MLLFVLSTTCLIKRILATKSHVGHYYHYLSDGWQRTKKVDHVSTYTEIHDTGTIVLCTVGIDTDPFDICGIMP